MESSCVDRLASIGRTTLAKIASVPHRHPETVWFRVHEHGHQIFELHRNELFYSFALWRCANSIQIRAPWKLPKQNKCDHAKLSDAKCTVKRRSSISAEVSYFALSPCFFALHFCCKWCAKSSFQRSSRFTGAGRSHVHAQNGVTSLGGRCVSRMHTAFPSTSFVGGLLEGLLCVGHRSNNLRYVQLHIAHCVPMLFCLLLNEALYDVRWQVLVRLGLFPLQELGLVREGFVAVSHQLQIVIKQCQVIPVLVASSTSIFRKLTCKPVRESTANFRIELVNASCDVNCLWHENWQAYDY